MSDLKIRIKVGEHEFEAEGQHDVVQAELVIFRKLVGFKEDIDPRAAEPPQIPLDGILNVKERIVSLKVETRSVSNAVLVLLMGQQVLRKNLNIMGSEIMAGLRDSGHRVTRADNVLKSHIADANVVSSGSHRRRRYRLTIRGFEKAQEIARHLAAAVPPEAGPGSGL